jgi:hypothetical protein
MHPPRNTKHATRNTQHALRPGYHFVESRLIGHKVEDVGEPMSIVAFLRCLHGHVRLPRAVQVYGLEPLLAHVQAREDARFLRRILADASDWLMQYSPSIVIFPITRITLNHEPYLVYDGQELRFAHVFGHGLQQEDVGYFAAPFALS